MIIGAKPGHVVGPVVVPPAVVDPMLQPSAWEGGDKSYISL